MGRPKGSKNLPKKQFQIETKSDPMAIEGGNPMFRLKNVDLENLHISLLGEIPGKGDWDFLLAPPFIKTGGLKNGNGFFIPAPPQKEVFEEAYASLGLDGKPATLLIFLKILGVIGGWKKTSVTYTFPTGYWGDQEYQEYDN